MKSVASAYVLANKSNLRCPICNGVNELYGISLFQQEFALPSFLGQGAYRRVQVKPSMEIFMPDVEFYEAMRLCGSRGAPLYGFAFSFENSLVWRRGKVEEELNCGESYLFCGYQGEGVYCYQPGQRYQGIRIEVEPALLVGLLKLAGGKENWPNENEFVRRRTSPSIALILQEIVGCRYEENLKKLYLEAKILELAAVYIQELVLEKQLKRSRLGLSLADMNALGEAKRLVEESLAVPPSLGELAQRVCLNEYKLKRGFKELFGLPVHAYVIEKRLEKARFLLEKRTFKVTEVALHVGYQDFSYFAARFKKKYGVTPSTIGE